MRSRWFDYSDLHPVKATYLFADHLKRQVRLFAETYVDITTAADSIAFTPDDVFFSRELVPIWLARREADRLGVPYDFYLRVAQDTYINKLFHRFPRPNQLYSEELLMDIKDAWEARLARGMVYSTEPRFHRSAWAGEVTQARHINFVIGQILKRPGGHSKLLGRMFNEGILWPTAVAQRFPEGVIADAQSVAAQLGNQSPVTA